MISEKMKVLISGSSAIRAMFEDGKKLAAAYGSENVYDFSLGNPSVYPPEKIKSAIKALLDSGNPNFLHGYMNNSGFESVREKIAFSLNRRFNTSFSAKNVIMTVGAAGGLNVILKVLLNPDDEVITFSPFFSEYRHYVNNYDGKLVVLKPNISGGFKPDADELRAAITPKTRALIVNTPNNPTGVVYSEEDIKAIASVLREKSKEYGNPVFLISDEPYRELVYDGATVPFLTEYYENTVVCYSYSKSLSLAGERIGYLLIPDEADASADMLAAANTATRILGFVNAPSLIQLAVAECLNEKVNTDVYADNRAKLMSLLDRLNFTFVKPDGAFYLFMKTPEDDKLFAEIAKKERLLLVPGSAFGCPDFVRIAYCVAPSVIDGSAQAFENLAKYYGLAN